MAVRVRSRSRNFRESGSEVKKLAVLSLWLFLIVNLVLVAWYISPRNTADSDDLSGVYTIHTRYTSSKANQDGYLKTELQNNEGKIEKVSDGYMLTLSNSKLLEELYGYSVTVDGGVFCLEPSENPILSVDGLSYKISYDNGILLEGDEMNSSIGSLILSVYASLVEEVDDAE